MKISNHQINEDQEDGMERTESPERKVMKDELMRSMTQIIGILSGNPARDGNDPEIDEFALKYLDEKDSGKRYRLFREVILRLRQKRENFQNLRMQKN